MGKKQEYTGGNGFVVAWCWQMGYLALAQHLGWISFVDPYSRPIGEILLLHGIMSLTSFLAVYSGSYLIWLLARTAYHDPTFSVAPGDNRKSTLFLNRTLELLYLPAQFIAWATRGSKVSKFIYVSKYGPHGAAERGYVTT